MFYENQDLNKKNKYKKMLQIMGSLSNLFSESDKPYLYYRCHENIFSKYFEARNLSREDCSADAQIGNVGVGLKTWVDSDNQKIAEFNKLKNTYSQLNDFDMVCKIAEYRNERIRITKNIHGIDEMIYHIVKRVPNAMQIYESAFDYIDIRNIKIIKDKSSDNNIYFTDAKHEYHFNISKSTLYMQFDDMVLLDSFDVNILNDPYEYLEGIASVNKETKKELQIVLEEKKSKYEQLCLRLYTINRVTKEKTVEEKSGLNQWNGYRRNTKTNVMTPRNPNELYIPYPAEDRNRSVGFFPPRNEIFEVDLPDGKKISAKVCQSDGKAIMSNPNSDLGEWLLRKVFELPVGKVITYEMLEIYGIDSVIFTKIDNHHYLLDFAYSGTYEKMLEINEQ